MAGIMETWSGTFKAIKPIFHLTVAIFMFNFVLQLVNPFMVDTMLHAICPGQTECGEVIIMLSVQEVIIGLCAIAVAPFLGGLSDDYGRKPVLTAIFITSIAPQAVLAYSRTKIAVYAWWGFWIIASVMRDGCLAAGTVAYILFLQPHDKSITFTNQLVFIVDFIRQFATNFLNLVAGTGTTDVVDKFHRPAAMGLTAASMSVGFLVGSVPTYFIKSGAQAYMVSVIIQISGAVYLMFFVRETNPRLTLLPAEKSAPESTTQLLAKPHLKRQTTSLRQTVKTVFYSSLLRRIASVDFLHTFGTAGLRNFTLYYLKATFSFEKDEYATLLLVGSIGSIFGQMVLYPSMSYVLGQRGALWIGLLGTSAMYFILSFTWAPWLPYLAFSMQTFGSFTNPAIGTLSSRAVDQEQQGKLQGILSSIQQISRIAAPLVLTKLTAASLEEHPLLGTRGLPFIVCGTISVLSWLVSLGLPSVPISDELDRPSEYIQAPMPPEGFRQVAGPPEQLLHVPIHPDDVGKVDSKQDHTSNTSQ